MKRFEIVFEYYDQYCRDGKWHKQINSVLANSKEEAVRNVIKFNGLGVDCEYRIVSVEER